VLPAIPDINLALQNVRTSEPMQGMAQDTEVNDRGRVPAELSDQIHGPAALYSPGTLSRHRRCGAARTCRIASIACLGTYALACMSLTPAA
jgi:hypothetical protein